MHIATGWGTTSFQGSASDVLLEILLPIWKQGDCENSYNSRSQITENQLCAGYKTGGRDSCQVIKKHEPISFPFD